MFEYLEGKVEYKKLDYVALNVNNVGYKVNISLRNYENIKSGETYRFYIYSYIREDSFKLIGFLNEHERKMFEILLSVKGIGLSLALAVLSTYTYEKIIELIKKEDYKSLKKVPKLGEKKAQLIILELKTKLKKLNETTVHVDLCDEEFYDMEDDIVLALEGLGYTKKEIDKILAKISLKNYDSIESAMKAILKNIREE